MLSIIIPTYNEEDHIKLLLDKLTVDKNSEIIVADGGSTDRTCEIVDNFSNIKLIHSEKGRALQMNAGASIAKGEILLFLHADTFLPSGFHSMVRECMNDSKTVAGSFFLQFDHKHPLLNLYSRLSRLNLSFCTYGDQAIFIRGKIFEKIGRYKEIPIMEDIEIQKRLRKEGVFIKLKAPVITSSRKFKSDGVLWNQIKNIYLVIFYLVGVSPRNLARYY